MLPSTFFPIYSIGKVLIRYLPTFLLRRYYNAERLSNLVYCDLVPRGESAQLDLGQVTTARVYLQLINLTPLPIELDRGQFSLQCAGAKIDFVHVSPRIAMTPGMAAQLPLQATIHEGSSRTIRDHVDPRINVQMTGYLEFTCTTGKFTKSICLSEIRPHLINR